MENALNTSTKSNDSVVEVELNTAFSLTSLLNSSFSLRWLNRSIDEDSIEYLCNSKQALINKCPNETWIDCMEFLDRKTLETMQLIANKFDLMVEKYFGVYPFRKLDRCKVKWNQREDSAQIILSTLPNSVKDNSGLTIETDSDLHLWLQHCYVASIEFIDFPFTESFLHDFYNVDPRVIRIDYCVFSYSKRRSEDKTPITEDILSCLLKITAFEKSYGAVFSFENRCSNFRPSIQFIFNLPQKFMVIDFVKYKPREIDYFQISKWLNGLTNIEDKHKVFKENGRILKQKNNKALSIKGFDFTIDSLSNFMQIIQTDFIKSTHKQHFIMKIQWWEENWDLELQLEERNLSRSIVNSFTEEQLTVKSDHLIMKVKRE